MILKLKIKNKWMTPRCEQSHKRGETFYDKRTKRLKTREAKRRVWQKEFSE